MAGILTPTVRKFWRAYIEKTRETTSTIDSPYIEASCDPYTTPTPTPYKTPTTPLYKDYQSGYQSDYQTTPTLTPTHIRLHLPLLPLLPLPLLPLSLSLERGFAPLPQCASRTGPPLPTPLIYIYITFHSFLLTFRAQTKSMSYYLTSYQFISAHNKSQVFLLDL